MTTKNQGWKKTKDIQIRSIYNGKKFYSPEEHVLINHNKKNNCDDKYFIRVEPKEQDETLVKITLTKLSGFVRNAEIANSEKQIRGLNNIAISAVKEEVKQLKKIVKNNLLEADANLELNNYITQLVKMESK